MQKAINYFFIPLFITVLICAFIIRSGTTKQNEKKDENYILKSYKNTVALYSGDELIEVYNDIVLNSLPKADIHNFRKGIAFESTEDVELYLEDFDS